MNREIYTCKPLEWDTKYFGVRSARVDLWSNVDEICQKKILEFSSDYEFVTIMNRFNRCENNYWIGEKTNAFLTDVNVHFFKELDNKTYHNNGCCVISNNFTRNDQIVNIASHAFVFSRFINDPMLPIEKAKNIYVHWTESAFNKDNKYFLFSREGEKVTGYILFSFSDDSCVIELLAVDKNCQGQGVGKSLLQMLEPFVSSKGMQKIEVGTQVNNSSAIQLYIAMGFRYISCASLYHMWRDTRES